MVMLKRTTPTNLQEELPMMGYPSNRRRNPYADSASTSNIKISFVLFCFLLPWLPYVAVRIAFIKAESAAFNLLESRQSIARNLNSIMFQRATLQEKERSIHHETGTLFATLRRLGALEDYNAHEILEDRKLIQIDSLHAFFKFTGRSALRELFRHGPLKVALDLTVSDHVSTFIVELPDVRDMPHAVHLFLDMVKEKAYEGAAMVKRKGALTVSITPPDGILRTSLVFNEPSVKKDKYSLCFVGLGPSFRIALEGTADGTCFGSVTGNNVLLDSLPVMTQIIRTRMLPST
jgi:hypothetical protein